MELSVLINYFGFIIIIISTFVILVLLHCVLKDWNYFSKNNVKFIRGLPLIGANYKSFLGFQSLVVSLQNIYHKYPKDRFIGMYEFGGKPFYMIRDPELVKLVTMKDFDHFANHLIGVKDESDTLLYRSLFTMVDQRWKDMRSTLSPAFTGSKMRAMCSLLIDVAYDFTNELKIQLKDRMIEYDMKKLFERYANDAIASCAFGIKINSMKDQHNEIFKTGHRIAQFELKFFLYNLIPKIMNALKIRVFDESATNYFRHIVSENMKYRERNNIIRPDMINLLLETKREVLANEPKELNDDKIHFKNKETISSKWTEDDLTAQSITFFLASFSTISSTLCYATHNLAHNPIIQEKLRAEIDACNKELNGSPVTYEIIHKMKYMDMVVSEVLRKRLGLINDRIVTKPYVLQNWDGTKVNLNVGDAIYIPSFALHMDPKYFPDPEKFDPERFNDNNKSNIPAGAFLPFGLGPRACIAARFAIMECKVVLYYLLGNFLLHKSPKTIDPFVLHTRNPEPKNGFWTEIRRRNLNKN